MMRVILAYPTFDFIIVIFFFIYEYDNLNIWYEDDSEQIKLNLTLHPDYTQFMINHPDNHL